MELRQLEYLVAVVDDGGFTRAAERLHVAQPGVSAQVRKLERELGEELLDRSGRSVRPTAVGAALLPYARAALDAVAGARHAVEELTGLVRGNVTVGMVTGCPPVDLPRVLDGFHRAHPDVEIRLVEDGSDRLVRGLLDGDLDLAVVGAAGAPAEGVGSLVVIDERIVAAVADDDPLAARTSMRLAALEDLPLIVLPRGTGIRSALDGGCATAGIEPRVAFEATDLGTLAELAGRGLGVAILPASVAAAHPVGLRAIELTAPAIHGRIEVAWRAEGPASPAARALVAHARAVLDEQAPATV